MDLFLYSPFYFYAHKIGQKNLKYLFSYVKFQNHHLAALTGIERRAELRDLQEQILLRQELERRQRALSEQDFMNQLVGNEYSQLTRQAAAATAAGSDSLLHHPSQAAAAAAALNLQTSAANRMFLSNEDQLRIQRQVANEQQQQHRQNDFAAVQRVLLQQHQEQLQQRELQQQRQELQELQELKKRKFVEDLLMKKISESNAVQNGTLESDAYNDVSVVAAAVASASMEPQAKKRKHSLSSGSIGSKTNSSKTKDGMNGKKSGSKKKRGEKHDSNKQKQKQRGTKGPPPTSNNTTITTAITKPQESTEEPKRNVEATKEVIQEKEPILNGKSSTPPDLKESSVEVDTQEEQVNEEKIPSQESQMEEEDEQTNQKQAFLEAISKHHSLEALLRAAQKSDANDEIEVTDHTTAELNSNNENGSTTGMEMLMAAVSPSNDGFTDDQAIELINVLKEIIDKDPTAAAYFGIPQLEKLEISPGFFADVPKLPQEPEFDESGAEEKWGDNSASNGGKDGSSQSRRPEDVRLDVTVPTFLEAPKKETKNTYEVQTVDSWFPSSTSIRKERRLQGLGNDDREITIGSTKAEVIQISDAMSKRLKADVEPGVLEKLPHCKVHIESYAKQYGKLPKEPVFCCQATETYCKSTMVCCSICSTWRHVECGGHYTHYSPQSSDEYFTPICDRCYKEQQILSICPIAVKRLSRQRSIQLRTVHAVTAIMRNSAYAKHGGTYKWPLGSVSSFHIGSHTKSIHLRHERAEKQWKEMAAKLNGTTSSKSSKAKSRTRDFERLMVNLEDAGKFK